MISIRRPGQKTKFFSERAVLFRFPRYITEGGVNYELFIGEKPFVDHPDVNDPVMNFFVYYVADGQVHLVTEIPDPGLYIKVRYDYIDPDMELIVYEAPGKNETRFTLGNGLTDIPGNFHGFPGSVLLRLHQIPEDPNIGWP